MTSVVTTPKVNKLRLRSFLFATVGYFAVNTTVFCHSFTPTSHSVLVHQSVAIQRRTNYQALQLFRELITDDEEDLRGADITVVKNQKGLDDFLKADERLCVIKLFAPWCKACRAFGVKFRKLATEKGDRVNAAGESMRSGYARFGEIDYAGNVKLCKDLGVRKFPTVLIFRGGAGRREKLSEIVCKQTAIEDIISEMDRLVSSLSPYHKAVSML